MDRNQNMRGEIMPQILRWFNFQPWLKFLIPQQKINDLGSLEYSSDNSEIELAKQWKESIDLRIKNSRQSHPDNKEVFFCSIKGESTTESDLPPLFRNLILHLRNSGYEIKKKEIKYTAKDQEVYRWILVILI